MRDRDIAVMAMTDRSRYITFCPATRSEVLMTVSLIPRVDMKTTIAPVMASRRLDECGLAAPEPVQIIGPRLHHPPTLREVFGVVIGGAYAVLLNVGQLPLDPVVIEIQLIQLRRGHAPEAVSHDLV